MKVLAGALLAPVTALFGLLLVVGGAGGAGDGGDTATIGAAAAACTYASAEPDRIAVAMEQLTAAPVTAQRWADYAELIDADPGAEAWASSTLEQRHQLLIAAAERILATTPPRSIATVPIVWWAGAMPVDDNDVAWQAVAVAGWDGTLNSYLGALLSAYATDPDVLAVASDHAQACQDNAGGGGVICDDQLELVLLTIRTIESGGRYDIGTNAGGASGAYQFVDSTWQNYAGYPSAYLAPPEVQDARAREDVQGVLDRYGPDVANVPVFWYLPAALNNPTLMDIVPRPDIGNLLTPRQYQAKWLAKYNELAAGAQPCPTGTGGAAAVEWGGTVLGAPYAAIDPWRFGEPVWPGGTRTGSRGDIYTFPAGVRVFDCSGFVIAAWRHAGVDFLGQYGISGSQGFKTSAIPDAPRDALVPGDIAVYSPKGGVGHVVMIHHVDADTGEVLIIQASPSKGVNIAPIDWTRVTAIKRPAL